MWQYLEGERGMILYEHLQFMWQTVILPRVGDVYVFGGSLDPNAVQVGTDCSGAVSECNEALLYGPEMNWTRQFWTGTFAGATPGNIGPFGNCAVTTDWVCIGSPDDAPADAAMIVSVLQLADPSSAHMVCCVPALDGTGLVAIESGGSYSEHGNSVLHIGPTATSVWDSMFNQHFYLRGPIVGWPPDIDLAGALSGAYGNITDPPTLTALAAQF